jgi:hypothetical protein
VGVSASWMRVFRTCSVPDRRRLRGGLPRIVQGSLVVGKNAGNFAESAVFWQNPSLKPLLTQLLADEFQNSLRGRVGNYSREQGIYSGFWPEQGIRRKTDPLAPTHPMTSKRVRFVDKELAETNRCAFGFVMHGLVWGFSCQGGICIFSGSTPFEVRVGRESHRRPAMAVLVTCRYFRRSDIGRCFSVPCALPRRPCALRLPCKPRTRSRPRSSTQMTIESSGAQ